MASGSIRKRIGKKGTTYQVIINHGRKPDGKRDQRSHGTFKKRKDAQDCLTKTLHEMNSGVYIAPSTMLLDDYAEHWFDTITVRQSSQITYRGIYDNHIGPVFGQTALGAITTTDIQTWFNDRRRRYQSAGQMLVMLNAILVLAKKQKLIPENPCDGVERTKERARQTKPSRVKTWTPDQLRRFLDLTRGHPDWPAWWVAAHTGVRPGELVALRWSDVDLDQRTIRIEHTQTVTDRSGTRVIGDAAKNEDSERTIGIDAETVMVLTGQRVTQNERRLAQGTLWQDDNLVFDRGDGQAQSAHDLSRRFASRAVYYGLPRLTLHGLRHTHGSLLAMNGRPLNYIQKRLGHASLETTARYYLHLIPGTEYADADLFAEIMRQAREG